jgi:hypothetical protein
MVVSTSAATSASLPASFASFRTIFILFVCLIFSSSVVHINAQPHTMTMTHPVVTDVIAPVVMEVVGEFAPALVHMAGVITSVMTDTSTSLHAQSQIHEARQILEQIAQEETLVCREIREKWEEIRTSPHYYSESQFNVITTRQLLKYIIDPRKAGNSMQPTRKQVEQLKCALNMPGFINLPGLTSMSEWLDVLGDGSMLYQTEVYSKQQEDQDKRADAIVKTLRESREIVITMFDGHGRMIYKTVQKLREYFPQTASDGARSFGDFTFEIYDIDDAVNDWHLWFFPRSHVRVITTNIFNHQLNGLVYFNFCGISASLLQTKRSIPALVAQGQPVFLSFATRGTDFGSDGPVSEFLKKLNTNALTQKPDGNNIITRFISSYGKFVSFEFVPPSYR